VIFSAGGEVLFTGSSDKSLQAINVATGNIFYKEKKAHDDPINVLYRIDQNVIASGDDEGCVKLWDLRQQSCIKNYAENEDFVSDMVYNEKKHQLLVTSGDGSMAIYDLRKNDAIDRTNTLDDEFLSITLMKNNETAVCGSQSGIIYMYKYGVWYQQEERLPGHPQSIDTMVKINEDLICTGSSDGLIRIVSIQPSDLVGIVGEHEDFPIERMRLSHDNLYLASSSHDNTIKFWNLKYLYEDEEDADGSGDMADNAERENYIQNIKEIRKGKGRQMDDEEGYENEDAFETGDFDDEDDEDDEEDDGEGENDMKDEKADDDGKATESSQPKNNQKVKKVSSSSNGNSNSKAKKPKLSKGKQKVKGFYSGL